MSESYDLIVLGAGMAGVASANKCASQGWRVAIVDPLPYGGTCALRGCNRRKTFGRGAKIITTARWLEGKGMQLPGRPLNWGDLLRPRQGFTNGKSQRQNSS